MSNLPTAIAMSIPSAAITLVSKWWSDLAEDARLELAASWSRRSETCRYSRLKNGWEALPVLIGTRFIPSEEEVIEGEDWNQDFYEYLISNPELILDYRRTFHICTAHPAAREVLRQGVIPASFECQLGNAHCPMKMLLAVEPGCSAKLFPLQRLMGR